MRAVAYIRKSTSGIEEGGVERQEGSFARQKASILDCAKRHGLDIVRWYEEAASGKSIRKRKIFLQLAREAKSPGRSFDVIIFEDYSRFMRDIKEAKRYEVELDDVGIKLFFANLQNDDSTAEEMYKGGIRAMAADYSKDLARRVIQGMVRKARMGSWLGGLPPYGYRRVKDTSGMVSLVVHEAEAKVLETIFRHSLHGWGHKKIATWLNDNGVLAGEIGRARRSVINKNADGKWSADTVRAILRNPVYKGVYRWNKKSRVDCFDWKLDGEGTIKVGKLRTQLPEFKNNDSFYTDRDKEASEWFVKAGAAPVIIPAEIFDKVQERFSPYSSRKWKRGKTVKYFMSGFLCCENCGNNLNGHRYGKIIKRSGDRAFYEYYRCAGDVRKGRSHGETAKPMMKREAVDRVVMAGMLKRAHALVNPARFRQIFKDRVEAFVRVKPSRILQVEQELKQIEKEMQRIVEAYTRFEMPMPEGRIKEINVRRCVLKEEAKALAAAGECAFFDIDTEVDAYVSQLKEVDGILSCGDPMQRSTLRNAFLQKAAVNWLAPSGVAEVKLDWYQIPRVLTQGGEFTDTVKRSTSSYYPKNIPRKTGGALITKVLCGDQGSFASLSPKYQ